MIAEKVRGIEFGEAYKLYTQIKKVTGLDIFRNTRKNDYIEARALFNFILYNTYGFTLAKIARFYKDNNKSYDHATALHSLKHFDMYRRFSPQVNEWLQNIKDTDLGDEATQALCKQFITFLSTENLKETYEYIKNLYDQQNDTESTD